MKYSFFFHYNKPASQQAGEPRLSVHWRGACHIVKNIACNVPINSRNRNTQPRCVMAGKAVGVNIVDGTAVIS